MATATTGIDHSSTAAAGVAPPPTTAAAAAGHLVTGPTVSSVSAALGRRVGDQQFDCGYTLRVQNGPQALSGLTAELVSVGASASVVHGAVEFVDLAPGELSADTGLLLIRQSSGCKLDKATARWSFSVRAPDAPRGVLLAGSPGLSALSVLRDRPEPAGGRTVSTTASPKQARLYALVGNTATVGQINAALTALGARIVAMAPAGRSLTLELPDPGSAESLQAVSTLLMASRAFEGVAATPIVSAYSQPEAEPLDDHRPN